MIGQEHLKKQLNNLSQHPRFILIVGPPGSGKQTFAKWIAEKFGHDSETITDLKIDAVRAVIDASLLLSHPKTFIFLNAQKMNQQAQNASLKMLEEANKNAYYIWTTRSQYSVLQTIRSRASVLYLEQYKRSELLYFTEDETLLRMCTTPGQVLRFLEFDYQKLIDHCSNVVNNISRVKFGNVFNILKHVEEKNYDLIIPILHYLYMRKMIEGENVLQLVKIIQDTSILLEHYSTINVRNALEMMFVRLWEAA